MNRLVILTIAFCAMLQPVFSQSNIKWSTDLVGKSIFSLIGSDDSQFYAIGNSGNDLVFFTFNHTGKLLNEKPINLNVDGAKDMNYYTVLHTAAKDYVVFLNRDKKLDKSAFYYTEVKNATLMPLTKSFHTFSFASTYGSGLGPAVAYDEEAVSGSFRISPDKKTIVTFGADIGHYDDQKINVVVFDENLKQTWSKDYAMDLPNRQVEVLELTVSNTGDVYVIIKKWAKLNDRYMGDKPVDYMLLAYTPSGVKEYELKLGNNYYPVDLTLQTDKEGKIMVLGTYRSLDLGSDYALGTFSAVFNTADKLTSKTFPFSNNVKTALNHTNTETKNNALSQIIIKNAGVLPNGHVYFTAEKSSLVLSPSGGQFIGTVIGQMLVTFAPDGSSQQVDYLQQPAYSKNTYAPLMYYSYQKDGGVVFVSNYVKLPVTDKGFKSAPVHTSVCYLEPGKTKECKDISTATDDYLVSPSDQIVLSNGQHVVMRQLPAKKTISFGVFQP